MAEEYLACPFCLCPTEKRENNVQTIPVVIDVDAYIEFELAFCEICERRLRTAIYATIMDLMAPLARAAIQRQAEISRRKHIKRGRKVH